MDTQSPFQCLIDSGLITEEQAAAINKIPASYANVIAAGMAVAGAMIKGTVEAADVFLKTVPGKRYSLLVGYSGESFGGGTIAPIFSDSGVAGGNQAFIPAPGEYLAATSLAFTEYGSVEFIAADEWLILSPDATVNVSYILAPVS